MITFTVSVIAFFLVFNALFYFSVQICTLYLTLYNKLNLKFMLYAGNWIISEVGGGSSRTVVDNGCHCQQKQSYSPWGTPSYKPYM